MAQHTFAIKLEQPAKFEGQMDHKILATTIWQVEKYMVLTGITNAGTAGMLCEYVTYKVSSHLALALRL